MMAAWEIGDTAALSNLFSPDPSLRVLGFAPDEWWAGLEEFLRIRETQTIEIGSLRVQVERIDAFEDGNFGWAALTTTVITSEARTRMRHVGVFRIEAGVWKVILWQNSVPVPNNQIFGVDLTTTLGDLVTSVLSEPISLSST